MSLHEIMDLQTDTEMINRMVRQEMERTTAKHGNFHSTHEGWAVIREEFKEVKRQFKFVRGYLYDLDMAVCGDYNETAHKCAARGIYEESVRLIKEAVQVAAMAQCYMNACDHGFGDITELLEGDERKRSITKDGRQ